MCCTNICQSLKRISSFFQVQHQGPIKPCFLCWGHWCKGGASRGGWWEKGLNSPETVGRRPQEVKREIQGEWSHRVHIWPGKGGPWGCGTRDGKLMIAGVVRKTYMEHKKETFLGINMDLDSSYYIYIYFFYIVLSTLNTLDVLYFFRLTFWLNLWNNKIVTIHACGEICHTLHVFVAWCVLAAGRTLISSSGNALNCRLLAITYPALPGTQWLLLYFLPFCLHRFLLSFPAWFLLHSPWVPHLMVFTEDFSQCGSHDDIDFKVFSHLKFSSTKLLFIG